MDLSTDPLPREAVETYQEYKRRQRILVSWLQEQVQPGTGHHANTRSVFEQRVAFQDIERLVQDITARKVSIPDDIFYVAQTMLKMRKEVGSYYKNGEDDGHEWCIMQFEKIVSRLYSLPRQPKSPERQKPKIALEQAIPEQQNRFASLPAIQMQGLGSLLQHPREDFKTEQAATARSRQEKAKAEQDVMNEVNPKTIVSKPLFLSPLYQIRIAQEHTFRLCVRAGQGQVPLHMAAYVMERAFLIIYDNWVRLMSVVNETIKDSQQAADVLRDYFDQFNEGATEIYKSQYSTYRTDSDLDEPLNAIRLYKDTWGTPEKEGDFWSITCSVCGPYREMLLPSHEIDQNKRYYCHLIKALGTEYVAWGLMYSRKLMLASSSRVTSLIYLLRSEASPDREAVWTSGLSVLRRMAQAYEFESIDESTYPQCDTRPRINCRLKTLSFMQEVSKALSMYGPPAVPAVVGYSTYHNLSLLEICLRTYLEDNRFDLVTQHPLFAGSDILSILDLVYRFRFQLLAFRHIFLGPLHVYNALTKLGVLKDHISILEVLCDKFTDAAFYGTRPSKHFLRVWKQLYDWSNISQNSASEARVNMSSEAYKRFKTDTLMDKAVSTPRGQWVQPDSRFRYNKRFKAEDYSFFHKLFNQESDHNDFINNETMENLLGEDALTNLDPKKKKTTWHWGRLCDPSYTEEEVCKEKKGGFYSNIERTLTALENALMKEHSDPFPLYSANMVKVWRHCYVVLTKVVTKRDIDQGIDSSFCMKAILSECDSLSVELRQCGADQKARDKALNVENMKKYKLIRRWKRAFAKEFGELTLQDFQWKHL